jgi:hypothetical protein
MGKSSVTSELERPSGTCDPFVCLLRSALRFSWVNLGLSLRDFKAEQRFSFLFAEP